MKGQAPVKEVTPRQEEAIAEAMAMALAEQVASHNTPFSPEAGGNLAGVSQLQNSRSASAISQLPLQMQRS